MCGGTLSILNTAFNAAGLSPHVRGNQRFLDAHGVDAGSIPACAGEPEVRGIHPGYSRVYPRMCGGTAQSPRYDPAALGLSPHVRGNRLGRERPDPEGGSIPACAGEPTAGRHGPPAIRVYPRMCGGTDTGDTLGVFLDGLSPHVRGNLAEDLRQHAGPRSIPACAGEPSPDGEPNLVYGVYPRMCGGTSGIVRGFRGIRGLSPHVRGNPEPAFLRRHFPGSIPACAGEPCPSTPRPKSEWVYPRMCGGTGSGSSAANGILGLSPHVRGNPTIEASYRTSIRSIPACAGEPARTSSMPPSTRVYPRMCGGT